VFYKDFFIQEFFMKRAKFYLSLLLILTVCSVLYGQTAQDILVKNAKARGGIKQLSAVKTIKYTGKFKQPGIDADLTMYFKSPDKLLLDVAIGEIKAKIGCDDKSLWKQNPEGFKNGSGSVCQRQSFLAPWH
jgi:hypothetical protein